MVFGGPGEKTKERKLISDLVTQGSHSLKSDFVEGRTSGEVADLVAGGGAGAAPPHEHTNNRFKEPLEASQQQSTKDRRSYRRPAANSS